MRVLLVLALVPATLAADASASGEGFLLAPYVDVLLWPPPDLVAAREATGIDRYTLGFVVGHGDACEASWGGYYTMGERFYAPQIEALRAAGGDVALSFGGAAGRELALVCPDADALAAAYRSAILTYGATRVDFDVEGAALADGAANDRRARAVAALQAEADAQGRSLLVSFTLPVMPWGLTRHGVDLLANASANGVVLARVNIMAMDYGEPPTYQLRPERLDLLALQHGQGPDMGDKAVAAAWATRGQLRDLGLARSDPEAWRLLSVTPMIGQNDVAHEVFFLEDAQQLRSFGQEVGLGGLAYWSLARDRPCPTPQPGVASPTCSGTSAPAWAFAGAFRAPQAP